MVAEQPKPTPFDVSVLIHVLNDACDNHDKAEVMNIALHAIRFGIDVGMVLFPDERMKYLHINLIETVLGLPDGVEDEQQD